MDWIFDCPNKQSGSKVRDRQRVPGSYLAPRQADFCGLDALHFSEPVLSRIPGALSLARGLLHPQGKWKMLKCWEERPSGRCTLVWGGNINQRGDRFRATQPYEANCAFYAERRDLPAYLSEKTRARTCRYTINSLIIRPGCCVYTNLPSSLNVRILTTCVRVRIGCFFC